MTDARRGLDGLATLPTSGRPGTALLAAWLVVGIAVAGAAAAGGGVAAATLLDAHDGTATVEAAADFGGGGPTADAGGPYAVDEGHDVSLDGTNSTATQGSVDSYEWTLADGAPGSLSGASTAEPTYHAPSDVDGDADVTVELTVTDSQGGTDTDRATITVRDTGAATVPSVDSLDVTTTGAQNRSLSVAADVSDPTGDADELANVTVEAVRTKNGNVDYAATIDVSGDDASVSDTTDRLKNGETYDVVVTVVDGSGDDATASETVQTG